MSPEARELYVMDWWLVLGTSEDADEFASGVSDRFQEHGARVLARLAARPRGAVAMGHAWFGAQLLWSMNATLRHTGNIGVDFHLGRAWNEFDCLALRPACSRRVCGAHDLLPTPWLQRQQRALPWPPSNSSSLPPRASLPNPKSEMAGSCEDHYFLCKRGSRRCVSAEAASPPADQAARRALFLGCAESLCSLPGAPSATSGLELGAGVPPANSTACAALHLLLWTNVTHRSGRGASGLSMPPDNPAHLPASRHTANNIRAGLARGDIRSTAHSDTDSTGLAVLHARVATLLTGTGGNAVAELPLSAVCLDAWTRSDGGTRFPTFRKLPASGF